MSVLKTTYANLDSQNIDLDGLGNLTATAVTIGDSRTASGTDSASFKDRGWFVWLNILLRQRLEYVNNASVPGDTTSQMLARVNSDVLAYNPGWVFHYGFVNDIQRPANDGSKEFADGIIANLHAIYTLARSKGAKLVVLSETPSTLAYNTAAKRSQVNYIMNWQREYCVRTPGCYFIDVFSPLLDINSSVGAGFSGYSYDELHQTGQGNRKMADACFKVLDGVIPKGYLVGTSLIDVCSNENQYGNILTNGCMAGSAASNIGTNVTGVTPIGWNNKLESGIVTNCVTSKVPSQSIFGAQEILQTVSVAQDNTTVRIDNLVTVLPAGINVGDTVFAAIDVSLNIISGNVDFCSLFLQFRDALNVQTALISACEGADNVFSSFSGRQRTKNFAIPANTTNIFFAVRTRANNGAQFEVRVGNNAELRKVRKI